MRRAGANLCATVLVVLALAGCGAVTHEAKLVDTYVPQAGSRVEIGGVTNATGQTPTVDGEVVNLEKLLSNALSEKLVKKDLLWTGDQARRVVLVSKIIEYEPGDAFKRWLLPGWGATVVGVECEVRDGDQLIGTVRARRTVSIGCGYTIGAWRTIFNSVAEDIVSDLREKFPK